MTTLMPGHPYSKLNTLTILLTNSKSLILMFPPERWIYPTSRTVTVISQIALNLQTLEAKLHLTLKLSAI
jgi:hypothetical protein